MSLQVIEFRKLVKIWWSHCHELGVFLSATRLLLNSYCYVKDCNQQNIPKTKTLCQTMDDYYIFYKLKKNYRCIQMSTFVEKFLKHFYSAGNRRVLWIYCTAKTEKQFWC